MRSALIGCLLLMFAVPSMAMELGGVMVQESVRTDDGGELVLNGAGIREKFFFDIYIAALYLAKPAATTEAVLAPDTPKRMLMHFLYSKVGQKKLVDAWNEGFEDNLSEQQLAKLQGPIADFNALFTDAVKGDVILLDYLPGKGTTVAINGAEKGVIAGKEFNDALLSIWLGKEPVTKDLKKALLSKAK